MALPRALHKIRTRRELQAHQLAGCRHHLWHIPLEVKLFPQNLRNDPQRRHGARGRGVVEDRDTNGDANGCRSHGCRARSPRTAPAGVEGSRTTTRGPWPAWLLVWLTAVSSQRLSTTCGGAQAPAPDKPPRTLCLVCRSRAAGRHRAMPQGSGSLVALCLYEYAGYEDRLLTRAKSAYGSLKCT